MDVITTKLLKVFIQILVYSTFDVSSIPPLMFSAKKATKQLRATYAAPIAVKVSEQCVALSS